MGLPYSVTTATWWVSAWVSTPTMTWRRSSVNMVAALLFLVFVCCTLARPAQHGNGTVVIQAPIRSCPPGSTSLVRVLNWWTNHGKDSVHTRQVGDESRQFRTFTIITVGEGLAPGPMSSLYLAGLQGGVIAAIVAGLVALLLLAARSKALAALGVGLAAVPFVSWVAAGVTYAAGVGNVPVLLTMLWPWIPAVLVGGALAWCGLRPAVRALVWLADLGLLWVVPAMFTAVQGVLGTRVLGGNLQEMAEMGKQVFAAALGSAGGAGPTILLALAIALPGAFVRFPPRKNGQAGREDHGV